LKKNVFLFFFASVLISKGLISLFVVKTVLEITKSIYYLNLKNYTRKNDSRTHFRFFTRFHAVLGSFSLSEKNISDGVKRFNFDGMNKVNKNGKGLSIYYVTGRGGTFFFLIGKIGHDKVTRRYIWFSKKP